MPVISDIKLSLDAKAVRRYLGVGRHSSLKAEIATLLDEMLASVNSSSLVQPAAVYELYTITAIANGGLSLDGKATLHGSLLSSVLVKAEKLAVVVYTIGPNLEKMVADCFQSKEPLRGLLLDGIGNAALDSVAAQACKYIAGLASSMGYRISSPLSPGMSGFPLAEQERLFELAPAGEIGVRLTLSGVMVPLKSTSMVIGMGAHMAAQGRVHACEYCNLKGVCLYRTDD